MPRYSQETRERIVGELENKIMTAMKEHVVLHSTELNRIVGIAEGTRLFRSPGIYQSAFGNLIAKKKIVGVSHGKLSRNAPRKGGSTSRLMHYYVLPTYANIVSWAKLVRKDKLHTNARVLLEMDHIAQEHPKGRIHYRNYLVPISFMREGLVKQNPYKSGQGTTKAKTHGVKTGYVRTKKFNTAVKVLKKVMSHRGIPIPL